MDTGSTSAANAANGTHPRLDALRAAFPHTVPILAGFVFLGITCGIYTESLGLPWWVPTLMSIAIFAGSAEFVVASLLTGPFDPFQTFAMIFVINARHLFYGLSMLERFRGLDRKRPYLIFAMCDETFSINYATRAPEGVDEGWFMTFVSLLNQLYWVVGCTLGAAFGNMLAMEIEGVSFAMTALFVVIFLDQWLKDASHAGSIIGVGASVVALALFGADDFIIPAMAAILVLALTLRGRIEPVLKAADAEARAENSTRNDGDTGAGTASPAATDDTPIIEDGGVR